MIGPIMMNIEGTELTAEDRALLLHPLVGGVIYFARNYHSRFQIKQLSDDIKSFREELLITVDQEGGRVQRFRKGFTYLPAPGEIGGLYDQDADAGLAKAKTTAMTMAKELIDLGVDFSYAPVLDLNLGISQVIGDRSFHADPNKVIALAKAWLEGVHEMGMAAIGKHFPGHGSVAPDSHVAIPKSEAELADLTDGIKPFKALIAAGIDAIMPAHIIFNKLDGKPVGFSRFWLQRQLRRKLDFNGAILSDDMSMKGASAAGDITTRCQLALDAGCDMVLVCNNRDGLIKVLDRLRDSRDRGSQKRLEKLKR